MKHLCVSAMLMAWALVATAQPVPGHADCVSFSIQGGTALDIYENAFSYRDNGRAADLFTLQGAVGVGYDFSEAVAVRAQIAFGNDAGAANTRNTSGGGFYPYSFKHANLFADVILNLCGLGGRATAFRPRIYTGVGGAMTFGFSDAHHPWQVISGKNKALGFRAGFIAEYTVASGFGFFVDVCGEAYSDMYNGLAPSAEDQKQYEGYGGFPYDLRGLVSLGMTYYF